MYLTVVYSFILTAVLVIVLKHLQHVQTDDPEALRRANKTLIATGFFLFLVFIIGFHWVGFGTTGSTPEIHRGGSGTIDYESKMLNGMMDKPVHTGFPPF